MFPIEEKYFSAGLNAWDPGLIQMLFFILSQPQPREHFDGVKLYEIYKTDFDPLVYKALAVTEGKKVPCGGSIAVSMGVIR